MEMEDAFVQLYQTTKCARTQIGADRAVQPLTNLLKDKNKHVRWHTVQTLESIPGESYGMNATY